MYSRSRRLHSVVEQPLRLDIRAGFGHLRYAICSRMGRDGRPDTANGSRTHELISLRPSARVIETLSCTLL